MFGYMALAHFDIADCYKRADHVDQLRDLIPVLKKDFGVYSQLIQSARKPL